MQTGHTLLDVLFGLDGLGNLQRTRTSIIHRDRLTLQFFTVESADGSFRLNLLRHLDEAETGRDSLRAILHDIDESDLSVSAKFSPKVLFRDVY